MVQEIRGFVGVVGVSSLQTRLESFRAIQPELPKRQKEVYLHIQWKTFMGKDVSNREISKALGLPINSVTGRVKELRDDGLVVEGCIRWDSVTRRNVTAWKAKL